MHNTRPAPEMVLGVAVVTTLAATLWLWSALDPALGSVYLTLARRLVESAARLGG